MAKPTRKLGKLDGKVPGAISRSGVADDFITGARALDETGAMGPDERCRTTVGAARSVGAFCRLDVTPSAAYSSLPPRSIVAMDRGYTGYRLFEGRMRRSGQMRR